MLETCMDDRTFKYICCFVDMEDNNKLIYVLHHLGLSQDILIALATYSHTLMSERHLTRILASLSLWSRCYSDLVGVARFIQKELSASKNLQGYKWICYKCQ